MADSKLTGLTELAADPAGDDWLYIVDKSDTTDDAAGSSRKLLVDRVLGPGAYNINPDGSAMAGFIGQIQVDNMSSAAAMIVNRLYMTPFRPLRSATITEVWIYVSTLSAGDSVRVGVYNANQSTGEATTLVSDIGTMSVNTTGEKSITGLTLSVEPQLYYWAIVSDGTPSLEVSQNEIWGSSQSMTKNSNIMQFHHQNRNSSSGTTLVSSGLDSDITSYTYSDVSSSTAGFRTYVATEWTEP